MLVQKIKRIRRTISLVKRASAELRGQTSKSGIRQFAEIVFLKLRGYDKTDYYSLKMYERSLFDSEFMGIREFLELHRRLNPRHTSQVEFNKWVFEKYFRALGIPTPRCLGLFQAEFGYWGDLRPLRTSKDLIAFLADHDQPIVFKPVSEGGGGRGVIVVERFQSATKRVLRTSGLEMSIEELMSHLDQETDGWIIQEKVLQHPDLSRLHSSSVNSLRVVTLRADAGEIVVLGAVLRIGVGLLEIDNTSGGGLVSTVALETGECGAGTNRLKSVSHDLHPDTGARIKGFTVPHWDEVKATAVRAHGFLPFPRTFGWDIAITESGPTLLETNGTYFHNGIQRDGKSLKNSIFTRTASRL